MAFSSSKLLSLLFLVLLFTFSQVAEARDSRFFSKVSNVKNDNDNKETTSKSTTTEVIPDTNKDDEVDGFEKEEDPTFTNDSQNEGYGLYGHESGQNPPFAEEKHFTTKRATTNSPVASYNDNFGKQGMSDTRFMANGKYFYDVSAEKTATGYNPDSSTNGYDEKNYDPDSYTNDDESNENDIKAVDYTNPKNWYTNRERNNRRYGQNSLTDNKAVDYSNPRNRDNNRGNDNRFYGNNNVNDNKHYNNNNKDVDYTNPKNWYKNRANDNSFYGDNKSNDNSFYGENKGNDNENYYNNNNNNDNKYYGSNNNDDQNDNSFEGYQNQGQTFQENQEFVP